ncbi:MAG: FIST C-terminal domain-containing protein [Gemmatimonadaceae bacterium]|jgi:hypothetical protein|nr:FIST C-terminal domain-containing protein [Gemmatimonadaceae bacterium]
MKIRQFQLTPDGAPVHPAACEAAQALSPHLLLAFGTPDAFGQHAVHTALRRDFPEAELAGCSTAGDISSDGVSDGSVTVTAIRFRDPAFGVAVTTRANSSDSRAAGQRLGTQLVSHRPHTIIVFGQGVAINGSALIAGIADVVGPEVAISGGLAGDAGAFRRTLVMTTSGPSDDAVVAIGLHGARLRVTHGSYGGWHSFGPERLVTHAEGNLLHAIDGEPALDLYKRYLGDHAARLPSSGLLFPFALLGDDYGSTGLIRTILGVNEETRSLVMAGDIPTNARVRLMHARADQLIDGAEAAAEQAFEDATVDGDALSLMVSCVGRRLVLGERADEEIEAVAHAMGGRDAVAGFYSYGEISPAQSGNVCLLHNQTMTISRWVEIG